MRRIKYPEAIDDFGLSLNRATRNALLESDGKLTLECIAHAVLELERRLGLYGTTDTTALEYRLSQLEAVAGITPAPPIVDEPTTNPTYADQEQAGIVSTAGALNVIALAYNVVGSYSIEVRGYTAGLLVEVGASLDGSTLTLEPASTGCVIEWIVTADLDAETGPRKIEGTETSVTTAGRDIAISPAFASINDYVVIADGVSGTIGIDVAVVKAVDKITVYPVSTCDVNYKIVGVTQ